MMRAPARPNPGRRQVSLGRSIPAPTGGWDASSPLAKMKPEYAVTLDNWNPEPGYLSLRRGHVEFATGVGTGPVETLMGYEGLTDSADKLFAASSDTIYDVTTGDDASSSVTGLSGGRYQSTNYSGTGGHFLIAVNGLDGPQNYNGSAWSTPTITGTGVTPADFVHVCVHKKRIWFVVKNSTKAAYLPLDSIQGEAKIFNVGQFFTLGGYLMAMGTWTIDAGSGPDDYAVFISSQGQVAVYQGENPNSSDSWALIGVFDLAPPIGRRCLLKVGSDLAVVTTEGIMPLSQAIKFDRAAQDRIAITARIQDAMNSASRMYSDNFGWELVGYPRGTKAILNVPVSEGLESQQYVMNTLTGAWCRYTGMDAMTFCVFKDRLFFGGKAGKVYEADKGAMDDGAAIRTRMVTAFNYFGQPGVLKQFSMLQPMLVSDGTVTPSISMNVDFRIEEPNSRAVEITNIGSNWDEVNWDEFTWAEDQITQTDWISVSGLGQCAAVHMSADVSVPSASASSAITLQVMGFNLIYQPTAGGFF